MFLPDEAATRALGAELAVKLSAGDIVLLIGELGAGKTTLVRGLLEGLKHVGVVRSPTFNLVQTFDTAPPVMHADLYRVSSTRDIGLEEYFDTHVCLIEWPDRDPSIFDSRDTWRIEIAFEGEGRRATVRPPSDR